MHGPCAVGHGHDDPLAHCRVIRLPLLQTAPLPFNLPDQHTGSQWKLGRSPQVTPELLFEVTIRQLQVRRQ